MPFVYPAGRLHSTADIHGVHPTFPVSKTRSTPASSTAKAPARREFSIDELAREAGTTVRNVRVYRERGLLPAPQLRGRTGCYTESHLARLRVIGRMLERGYTLANVAELLEAWAGGQAIGNLLGLEEAVTSPWSDETPTTLPLAELLQRFGGMITPAALAKAGELGVFSVEGANARIPSMKLLQVGEVLAQQGVPLEELLTIMAGIRRDVERGAGHLVQMIVKYLFDPYGSNQLPPPAEAPRLAELIWQLRPLAMQALDAELARAMEKAANQFLGDRLAHVLDQLHPKPAE